MFNPPTVPCIYKAVRRLPFWVGTKVDKTERESRASVPTSSPSDAGRRPSVFGMPRAARGCARASYPQPWWPRRPPSRMTTSSDKLGAEGDARRDVVQRSPLAVAIATKQPIAYGTQLGGPAGSKGLSERVGRACGLATRPRTDRRSRRGKMT